MDPSVLSQINYLHELITTDCCSFSFTRSLSHLPPSLSTSSFAPPFPPIFQGHCYYYTKLDQVAVALCCLTASSLLPAHPTVTVLVTQSCPTLCDPVDCSPPGSSVHGLFQARLLEWIAFPFPGDLLDPGIKPGSPALQEDFFLFFFFHHLNHQGSQPALSYIPSLSYFLKMPCFHPVSSVHKDEQGLVRARSLQCGVHELFPVWLCPHPSSLPLREWPPSPSLLGCFPLKVCQPEILSVHFCWGRGEEIERG